MSHQEVLDAKHGESQNRGRMAISALANAESELRFRPRDIIPALAIVTIYVIAAKIGFRAAFLGTRELFAAILGTQGARVLCAASAVEALKLFKEQRPHALLIDIGMPGENGFMLLQRIRTYEAETGLPPTPALAVTAYAGAVARQEVLEAGFIAHVPKPVLPHDLVTVLLHAMNQRR